MEGTKGSSTKPLLSDWQLLVLCTPPPVISAPPVTLPVTLFSSMLWISSMSKDSVLCPKLFFLCRTALSVRGSPSFRRHGLTALVWAMKEATRGTEPGPRSSARELRHTASWSPGLTLFTGVLLSPGTGGDCGVSGVEPGGSWELRLWIWLRDFFDARWNSMPTRRLLSWASAERSFPTEEEEEAPTKEEKAVVT